MTDNHLGPSLAGDGRLRRRRALLQSWSIKTLLALLQEAGGWTMVCLTHSRWNKQVCSTGLDGESSSIGETSRSAR